MWKKQKHLSLSLSLCGTPTEPESFGSGSSSRSGGKYTSYPCSMYLIDSSATRFLPCFAHWARAERDLFRTTQPPPLEQEQQSRGWQSWWSERQCECLSVRVSVCCEDSTRVPSVHSETGARATRSPGQVGSATRLLCHFAGSLRCSLQFGVRRRRLVRRHDTSATSTVDSSIPVLSPLPKCPSWLSYCTFFTDYYFSTTLKLSIY